MIHQLYCYWSCSSFMSRAVAGTLCSIGNQGIGNFSSSSIAATRPDSRSLWLPLFMIMYVGTINELTYFFFHISDCQSVLTNIVISTVISSKRMSSSLFVISHLDQLTSYAAMGSKARLLSCRCRALHFPYQDMFPVC